MDEINLQKQCIRDLMEIVEHNIKTQKAMLSLVEHNYVTDGHIPENVASLIAAVKTNLEGQEGYIDNLGKHYTNATGIRPLLEDN